MAIRPFFSSFRKKTFLTIPADPSGLHFLYRTDPTLFLQIVENDNNEQRVHALKLRFHDALLGEIFRYAMRHDATVDEDLQRFYALCIRMMPDENRRAVQQAIVDLIENASLSAHALLPCIWGDTERFVVGPAVDALLNFAPLTDNDPMSRPKDIIAMIEAGMIQNPGAAFGGLLHFGSRDVCDLVWPVKDQLDIKQVIQGVMSYTGSLSAACIEFEIAWLEHINLADKELFGAVAYALRAQRLSAREPVIATGTRKFSLESTSPEEILALARLMRIEEYVRTIAPRLQALAEREPLLMPAVASARGVELGSTQQLDRPTQH